MVYQILPRTKCEQARNERGTPGGAKRFLGSAQNF